MAEEKEEKKLTEETAKEEKPGKAPPTRKVKESIVFVGSKPPIELCSSDHHKPVSI